MSSFNFGENIVSAETTDMQSAAASHAGLADDTANAGTQVSSCGKVVPPGGDPQSAQNATEINTYTSEVSRILADAGILQNDYSDSISNSATGYNQVDEMGAATIASVEAL